MDTGRDINQNRKLTLASAQVNKKWTAQKEVYITELREPLALSPQDKTFFVRLDAQLTEVNKFFRSKEAEYIDRARVLEKQMLALINLEEEMARRGLTTSDCLATRDDHLPGMRKTVVTLMVFMTENQITTSF